MLRIHSRTYPRSASTSLWQLPERHCLSVRRFSTPMPRCNGEATRTPLAEDLCGPVLPWLMLTEIDDASVSVPWDPIWLLCGARLAPNLAVCDFTDDKGLVCLIYLCTRHC